jgi:hypothetical protein
MQVQDLALYHHGNPGCDAAECCSVDESFDISVCSQLLPVFGPTPILSPQSGMEQPILSIAVEGKEDRVLSTKVGNHGVSSW